VTLAVDTLFELRGKTALVAGASRGLGAAIASGLASAGARVVAVGRSRQADVPGAIYKSCDVQDAAGFSAICDELCASGGQLDIYVHAAGVTHPETDQRPQTFRKTIETNLSAAYECSRAAAARMPATGGAIVFVTSIGARLGFPDNPGYAASKGGLQALTRALAVDLGPRGIRVNAVAPGYMRTAMTEASYADPDRHEARRARTILGRWGTSEDVVGTVVYLVSAASAYVTGQEIAVDGGWTVRGL
jgi:NAD(P)-dependent dehydrogenase (short-subunit alcohol dehydrogenase family)